MKRTNIGICLLLAGGITACVGGDLSHDSGEPKPEPKPERVPITLQAGNSTKAVVNIGEAFAPLLVCSDTEKDYKKLRWRNNATVNSAGSVSYDGYPEGEGPLYPEHFPFNIYVSGVHPNDADLTVVPNSARYTIDGTRDVMYAPEVFGNYQDGERIYGNTDNSKDQSLKFTHLLTQLQFKAYRTANANVKEFRISRITLKKVPVSVTVSLADGSMEVAEATQPMDAPLELVPVTSTDENEPTTVGYALLPASAGYTADVETTFGTFTDVQIRPTSGNPLMKGQAHSITLKLNDKGLSIASVTIAGWKDVDGGEIPVN